MVTARITVKQTKSGRRLFLGKDFPGVYFTPREAEVVQLLHQFKYREIGELLTISRRTAEYYTQNMKKKLHVYSKRELVNQLNNTGVMCELAKLIDVSYLFEIEK